MTLDRLPEGAAPAHDESRTRRALLHMLDELQRDRGAIGAIRTQWIETVDAIPLPIMVHDSEQRIVRANKAYAALAGIDSKDLVGRHYWECFPRRDGPVHECLGASCVSGALQPAELSLPGGQVYTMRAFGLGTADSEAPNALHIFENVTAQRQREGDLFEHARRAAAQAMALGAINSSEALLSGDVERLAALITEHAARACEVARVNVWLFSDDERELHCIDHYDAGAASHSSGMVLRQEEFENEFRALKAAPYVAADEPLTDPRTTGYVEAYLKPNGITSMLDTVVQYSLRHVGLLCFEHVGRAHHWEDDEIAFAAHVTNAIAIALSNRAARRGDERVRELNRALKTVSAGNEVLVRATDEASLLKDMARVLTRVGGYAIAAIGYALDDPDRSISIAAAEGVTGDQLSQLMSLSWADDARGQTCMGRAIRLGAVQLATDPASDPDFAPLREMFSSMAIGSVLGLPLRLRPGEAPVGAIGIASAHSRGFGAEEQKLLEELAENVAYGIANLRGQAERLATTEKLRRSLEGTVEVVAATMEMRDPYTAGHQRRVAGLAAAIAVEMGMPAHRVEGIHFGSLIHDLGKIQVPAEILAKPTRLTKLEYEMIKIHPQSGYDIVKGVDFPWPVALMVLQHHERIDGSGYPQGLKGDEIIAEARILAVADVVEAMSSHRPYRAGLGIEAALAEIVRGRGAQLDAEAVDACVRLFREKGFVLQTA